MKKIPKMSYLYPRLPKRFDECIYREQTASCSLYVSTVRTAYETCSRRVVCLTTTANNRLRFWLEDAQTILCNTWHDKLPFDQPTCRLLTHSGRKTSFILFFLSFFSEISVQWSTIVINGIQREQDFWEKCWNCEFLRSSIIKQIIPYILLPISHAFMCRVRSYARTVDTFQIRSIHAHWPSSLVYWWWTSYLVESFNFDKKYSLFLFFFFFCFNRLIIQLQTKETFISVYV